MIRLPHLLGALALWLAPAWIPLATAQDIPLTPRTLTYAPGGSISLNLPASLDINVAASGLHRVRFLTQAPDGRIFATGMWNLADNSRGSVFILDGWDAKFHRFAHVATYLDGLRNPNNLAFWTDPATGKMWLYLPLTDRLERFPFKAGDKAPSGPAEVLMRFPDYGLNYKYGGWHLTRTVAIADLHGKTQVYVAAGSSCDYCKEREVIRATVSAMNPDGSEQRVVAHGIRNAVDLRFVPELDGGALIATDMGDDHLGPNAPEDTFFELDSNARPGPIRMAGTASGDAAKAPNYGWPTCYFAYGKPVLDTTPLPDMPPPGDPNTESERPAVAAADPDNSSYGAQPGMNKQGTLLPAAGGRTAVADPNAALGTVPAPLTRCGDVPPAYTTFAAHSSPLGAGFFGADNPRLHGSFLVALHGASRPGIGTGYRVVSFRAEDRTPRPFITGFLTAGPAGKPVVHGRPCALLRVAPDTFLLTDDKLGLVYYVHPRG